MAQNDHMTYDAFAALAPKTSGNTVNGLGERDIRRPSPFFWHPPDKHEFGELQAEVIGYQRRLPEITEHYSSAASRGPGAIEIADQKAVKTAEERSRKAVDLCVQEVTIRR